MSEDFDEYTKKLSDKINYLEEFTLIFLNILKECFILFLAIIVIINYYININKENPLEGCIINNPERQATADTKDKRQNRTNWLVKVGPWECIKDIMGENLQFIIDFFKCIPSFVSFLIFIGIMYIFFNVVKTPKSLSLTNQTFKTSLNFIFQDFGNKLMFVLLFPTLLICTISLIYISYKIMVNLPTKGIEYGYIMAFGTKIFMFSLFFILFFTIAQTLYYLLTRGNISYLYNITAFDAFIYFISGCLIFGLIFAGFWMLIAFNLMSTFNPFSNFPKIMNSSNKEILFYLYVSIIILFITLAMNVQHLFSIQLQIFSYVMAGILILLTTYQYSNNYLSSLLPANQ